MVQATDALIGEIYDCAASPDRWPDMLSLLRDRLGAAYCLIGFADISANPVGVRPENMAARMIQLHSPWDEDYIRQSGEYLSEYPGAENYMIKEHDQGWTQMSVLPEVAFRQHPFYLKFCKPQSLRDCLNLNVVKRPDLVCGLAIASADSRELFSPDDVAFVEHLSAHLRRALMINDVTDKGRLAMLLFRKMLDQLTSAVFLIGHARKIEFTNAAAEELLRNGNLVTAKNHVLIATHPNLQAVLEDALNRAAKGDGPIGISGIGVPLIGADGTRAAAYVLPMGKSEIRNELGRGHCAVFVAQRGEQMPVMTEILRTLFDLTPTEAKVSTLIAKGDKPQDIAEALQLSINTVRTHLARTFAKTQTPDQTSLINLIRQLSPPVLV